MTEILGNIYKKFGVLQCIFPEIYFRNIVGTSNKYLVQSEHDPHTTVGQANATDKHLTWKIL